MAQKRDTYVQLGGGRDTAIVSDKSLDVYVAGLYRVGITVRVVPLVVLSNLSSTPGAFQMTTVPS